MPRSITDWGLYGEYNWDDPIYKVLRRETASPRFKIYLMKKGVLNLLFYQYTDFLGLRVRGGEDIDDLMRKQRNVLIDEGLTTEENEKMKQRFSDHHLPYGDLEPEDYRYGPVWCG